MKQYQSACPLDCWDACSILVSLDENGQPSVAGDPTDPITQGFLCGKVQKMVAHFNHSDRLTSPMKRRGINWEEISWEEALDDIAAELKPLLDHHQASSLIHYSEGGHGGLSKHIDTAFFNALGGATTPTGSLCWGAGIAAQKLDFGNAYCHPPSDLANTRCLLLWGRNPAETNIHLVPFIQKVRKAGVPVYLIDPVNSASTSLADYHLALKPGSDGHLALAMAKYLIDQHHTDCSFMEQCCQNTDTFIEQLHHFSYDDLIYPTGLDKKQVFQMAEAYGTSNASTIYLGYGMQRQKKGGVNVRLIDALAALTGNIGIPGGGVNYAHRYTAQWIDDAYLENRLTSATPAFPRSHFADYVLQRKETLKGIFVTKSNPIIQLPDTNRVVQAFQQIPFKVVIDHFMTDTAQLADYVLPPTMILEESDLIFSSMWHNRFTWTEKAIEPPDGVMHEFDIFQQLAQRLKMKDYLATYPSLDDYLSRSIAPLCLHLETTAQEMRGRRREVPSPELPWQSRVFETPTGRFTFCPVDPGDFMDLPTSSADYPLHLISVHRAESLHSQHMGRLKTDAVPVVRINPSTASKAGTENNQRVRLVSARGSLVCSVALDPALQPGIVVLKQGTWLKNGAVNQLTSQSLTDIGQQVAYHDCYCRMERN